MNYIFWLSESNFDMNWIVQFYLDISKYIDVFRVYFGFLLLTGLFRWVCLTAVGALEQQVGGGAARGAPRRRVGARPHVAALRGGGIWNVIFINY